MPNWKKVLLSGSKASVYDITASNLPGEPNKTTDVVVISDTGRFLTASRNDFGAASGPDKAIQFAYTEDGTVFQNSGSDKFTFDEESVELIISAAGEGQINVGRTDKPSSGETLGSLNFVGTGSFTIEGPTAKIEAVATQNYTAHAKGGKLNFYTSNNGDAGTPSGLDLKMTISESGVVFNTNIIATDITASGDISSSGTITGNSLIGTVNTATQGTIDHDSLANFVANEHIDHTTVSIFTGNGLTGGGTIASDRTISVDYAGTGNIITDAPNDNSTYDVDEDKILRYNGTNDEVQDTTISNFISGYNLAVTADIPTNNNELSNGAGYLTSPIATSSITDFPTEVSRSAATFGFGTGGGGTLDEVTTSGNQTDNTIRVGELTASLITDPANINVTSGDTTGSGTQDVVTVQHHSSPPAPNYHTFVAGGTANFNITTGFTGYTGNLFLEKVRIKGDVDTAYNEFITGFYVGNQYIFLEAKNVTPNASTYATILTGSRFHIDQGIFATYTPSNQLPNPPYIGLSQDGNFKLQFANGDINEITCTNGVVAGQVTLGAGVNPALSGGTFTLEFTFRKPTPSFNNGAGLFSGVNSNNFATQIKHVGSANSDGQDPSGLLISLGSSDNVNNAEFIRFTSHFGGLTETLNDVILSDSEVGSIIMSNGQATLAPPSDKRLKENIVPISSSLNQILNLNPVDFTWKSTNTNNVGFIAQEIYDIIPYAAIPGNENNPWKLNYNNIIPYLVKAIQEQQVIIEDLKTQINNLPK